MSNAKKVIKISPELDQASANKLNRDTKKAFSGGSGFSRMLVSGFTQAGIAFAAAIGIGKLIDSANDIGDNIAAKITDRLRSADTTVTRAGHYGVNVERLGRLEDIAFATGIKNQTELYNAIDTFGKYIREQKEKGTINADTYSDNTFDAFLQFIDRMKKSGLDVRQAEMFNAFGQNGAKFARFIDSDWDKIESRLGARTTGGQWRDMAGLNNELDLQQVLHDRSARNTLSDSLEFRNYAIERNLITDIQNKYDAETRGIATTWGRDIKRTVGYMTALGESVKAVTALFHTMSEKTPPVPTRHRPSVNMPAGMIAGMAMPGPNDNRAQMQQTKNANQNKKGINAD